MRSKELLQKSRDVRGTRAGGARGGDATGRLCPPNPHVKVPVPVPQNVAVFGDGTLEKWLSYCEAVRVGPGPAWPVPS